MWNTSGLQNWPWVLLLPPGAWGAACLPTQAPAQSSGAPLPLSHFPKRSPRTQVPSLSSTSPAHLILPFLPHPRTQEPAGIIIVAALLATLLAAGERQDMTVNAQLLSQPRGRLFRPQLDKEIRLQNEVGCKFLMEIQHRVPFHRGL